MAPMTRNRPALILTTAAAALFAVSACGAAPAASPQAPSSVAALSSVADEAVALRSLGLEAGPAPTAAPSASAPAPGHRKGKGARKWLRKNTLHGEMTVQGRDGAKTIVVQRGTVTAVDAKTVSVKSTDGFALTWTLGDKVRVVHDRKKAEISEVKVGAEVGLAGVATTARLIVVK
jgi:hypothetical protein